MNSLTTVRQVARYAFMLAMVGVFAVSVLRAFPPSAHTPASSALPKVARPARAAELSGVTGGDGFRWASRREPALFFGWAAALWLAGVIPLSTYTACGWMRVRTQRRGALAPTLYTTLAGLVKRLGITRPVRLYLSVAAEAPAVIGYLRPYVLLPISALTGLDEPQLTAALAHELAHIRRHDYLVNMLQAAVETVLFYHPAVGQPPHS